jgi:hypothetical protein
MKHAAVGFVFVSFVAAAASAMAPEHFSLEARYEPPAKGQTEGAIAVYFSPLDADLKLNESPAPRLVLDPSQMVLEDKQAPLGKRTPIDPEKVKGLDLSKPVRFPVARHARAAKGEHPVKATVNFFYCSKREAWCRRGKQEVELKVVLP